MGFNSAFNGLNKEHPNSTPLCKNSVALPGSPPCFIYINVFHLMWLFNIWILLLCALSKIFQTPKKLLRTRNFGKCCFIDISAFLWPCAWRVIEQATQQLGMAWVGGHHLAPPSPLPRPPVRATYLNLASFQRNSHWLLQMVYHWYISVIHIWLAECFISTLQKVKIV